MAAGQGPPRELKYLGPMSEELGRGPTGKSLRLAAEQAAEAAAQEVTGGDPAQLDALAQAVDAAVKSVDPSLSMSSLSGARRVKGGQVPPGKRQKTLKGEPVAPGPDSSNLDYLKKVAAKLVEYAKVELAPITPATTSAIRGAVGLTQELVIRVPVTLVTLSLSGTALSVNFFKSLFAKFNAWGRASATEFASEGYAAAAADAATKDLNSIATTTAVTAFFFNNLGLLPLEVVLAAILYGLRINLATAPGRSLLVSQFYTWYVQRPKREQQEIMTAAKKYTIAVAEAGKTAASSAVAVATSDPVKTAAVTLATKIKGFLPAPADSTQTIETALTTGQPAASAVLVTENVTSSEELKEDAGEVQPPKSYRFSRRKLGPSTSSPLPSRTDSSSSLPPPSPTSSLSELPPGVSSGPASAPETRRSSRLKREREGGKRKTKRKGPSKRRATPRRAGVFAY